MIKTTSRKKFDPFAHLVLDEYEKELEESFERGEWKRTGNFQKRKKEIERAARNTLEARKTKRVTFRISQGDLIKLKARAVQRSIPYQTLLTVLIRDYIDGEHSVQL